MARYQAPTGVRRPYWDNPNAKWRGTGWLGSTGSSKELLEWIRAYNGTNRYLRDLMYIASDPKWRPTVKQAEVARQIRADELKNGSTETVYTGPKVGPARHTI